jgi:hypothetical protein
MKKAVLLSSIMLLFLFSCKREHSASTTTPHGKKYPVTFNVANFLSHQTNFAIKHGANHLADTVDASASGADVLYYFVYDQFGAYAHNFLIMQDSTNANFGIITDSLPAGNYEIAFVAGKKGLQINNYGRVASAGFTYGGTKWQDTFWDDFNLTVGTSGVSQNVTLKRVVGKLEIDLTDAIPANADSLKINVNPETNSMWVNAGFSMGPPSGVVNYSEKIPASAIGTTNFTMDRLIGNTEVPFTVTITCTNTSNAIIGTATVDNVSVQANMKTILSGNLFGGTPPANSQSFTVKVDTAWSSTVNHTGF